MFVSMLHNRFCCNFLIYFVATAAFLLIFTSIIFPSMPAPFIFVQFMPFSFIIVFSVPLIVFSATIISLLFRYSRLQSLFFS